MLWTLSARITQKECHSELHHSTVTHFPNYAYTPLHMKCINTHCALLVIQLISNHKYIQCTRFTIQLIAKFWICKCSLSQEISRYRCCIQMQFNSFSASINTGLFAGCAWDLHTFWPYAHWPHAMIVNMHFARCGGFDILYRTSRSGTKTELWGTIHWAHFLCQNRAKLPKFCEQNKESMATCWAWGGVASELSANTLAIWELCSLPVFDITELAVPLLTFPVGLACDRAEANL